jgi:hypothetical protein
MPAMAADALKLTFFIEITGLQVPDFAQTLMFLKGEQLNTASSIKMTFACC